MLIDIKTGKPLQLYKYPTPSSPKSSIPLTETCILCSTEYETKNIKKTKRCPECKALWKTFTARQKYSVSRSGLSLGLAIRDLDLSKCSICQYPFLTDIHHIDHNKFNNDLSNLIVLCPNCHMLHHRKEYSMDKICDLMKSV